MMGMVCFCLFLYIANEGTERREGKGEIKDLYLLMIMEVFFSFVERFSVDISLVGVIAMVNEGDNDDGDDGGGEDSGFFLRSDRFHESVRSWENNGE